LDMVGCADKFFKTEFTGLQIPNQLISPVFHFRNGVGTAVVCIIVGLLLLFLNPMYELEFQYSNQTSGPIAFNVDKSINELSILIQYEGMYSNHRVYVKSSDQTIWDGNCDGAITVDDALRVRPELTSTFAPFNGTDLAPCGYVAFTMPFDTFTFTNVSSGEIVPISPIVYTADDAVYKGVLVVNGSSVYDGDKLSWLTPAQIPLFKVWNRVSPTIDYRINYGSLINITKGNYILNFTFIESVWSTNWNVTRTVVLLDSSPLGAGNGNYTAILYLSVGLIYLISGCAFGIYTYRKKLRI